MLKKIVVASLINYDLFSMRFPPSFINNLDVVQLLTGHGSETVLYRAMK